MTEKWHYFLSITYQPYLVTTYCPRYVLTIDIRMTTSTTLCTCFEFSCNVGIHVQHLFTQERTTILLIRPPCPFCSNLPFRLYCLLMLVTTENFNRHATSYQTIQLHPIFMLITILANPYYLLNLNAQYSSIYSKYFRIFKQTC